MLKTVGNPSTRFGDQTISNGNLIIDTAGKGIDFSATSHATGMTSELLDDYEEGTWTPELVDGSYNPSEGQAYTVQTGRYTKIGDRVFLTGTITMSSLGTLTGGAGVKIIGIPFTPINVTSTNAGGPVVSAANINLAAAAGLVAQTSPNAAELNVRKFSAVTGTQNMTITELTASGSLSFACMYQTA